MEFFATVGALIKNPFKAYRSIRIIDFDMVSQLIFFFVGTIAIPDCFLNILSRKLLDFAFLNDTFHLRGYRHRPYLLIAPLWLTEIASMAIKETTGTFIYLTSLPSPSSILNGFPTKE